MERIIETPLTDDLIETLKVGDLVYLTGYIFTARDAAHKRLAACLDKNEPLPFDVEGQIVYYAGPCPNKPGYVIGPIGPTTSTRMDKYSPKLIAAGLKGMLGKGERSQAVKDATMKHKGIYFAAIGGVAALMAKCVKSVEVVAFEDLGTEAIRRLYVEKMPLIVALDSDGGNIYKRDGDKLRSS